MHLSVLSNSLHANTLCRSASSKTQRSTNAFENRYSKTEEEEEEEEEEM
jgi:hypothetical protein